MSMQSLFSLRARPSTCFVLRRGQKSSSSISRVTPTKASIGINEGPSSYFRTPGVLLTYSQNLGYKAAFSAMSLRRAAGTSAGFRSRHLGICRPVLLRRSHRGGWATQRAVQNLTITRRRGCPSVQCVPLCAPAGRLQFHRSANCDKRRRLSPIRLAQRRTSRPAFAERERSFPRGAPRSRLEQRKSQQTDRHRLAERATKPKAPENAPSASHYAGPFEGRFKSYVQRTRCLATTATHPIKKRGYFVKEREAAAITICERRRAKDPLMEEQNTYRWA